MYINTTVVNITTITYTIYTPTKYFNLIIWTPLYGNGVIRII